VYEKEKGEPPVGGRDTTSNKKNGKKGPLARSLTDVKSAKPLGRGESIEQKGKKRGGTIWGRGTIDRRPEEKRRL